MRIKKGNIGEERKVRVTRVTRKTRKKVENSGK